jgi:type IV pilus assembly protein PilA
MMILGILASIALPAFLNQRDKANDAKAKLLAHSSQVAMEACATNHQGSYTSCDLSALRAIEPTIPASGVVVENTGSEYTIKVTAAGGNSYSVTRSPTGAMSFPCTVSSASRGGCPGSGIAAGVWG